MAVESATYINQLDATKPGATDLKSEGDDHLRLVKSAVKATFPNVTGAVTATHTELSKVGITQPSNSNDTSVASTSFVQSAILASSGITAQLPAQSGNAGKFLKTDGSISSWSDAILLNYQEFTSSGTWTKPVGASWVYVELVGGGAGGPEATDTAATVSAKPWGGAGGEFNFAVFRASDLTATVTATVGAGGAGATATRSGDGSANGTSGGNTTFGAYLIANGGSNTGEAKYATPYFQGGGTTPAVYNSKKGGAGGASGGTTASTVTGGVSEEAGNGGDGVTTNNTNATATSGAYPGGGGGRAAVYNVSASRTTTAGSGSNGRIRVWCW